ncbi:MAG: heavy metal-associated domain-containing protein [Phycisphaerae bacterium]
MAAQNLEIDVQGMSCQHCVAKVTAALTGVSGVEAVRVDLPAGKAHVTLATPVATATLLAAVQKAGFTPAGFRKVSEPRP